jgi:hypothetical protein
MTVQSGALEWDEDGEDKEDLKDQVLVFRYRDKFHAIDHVRLARLADYPAPLALHSQEHHADVSCHGRNVRMHPFLCQKARHSTSRILASF